MDSRGPRLYLYPCPVATSLPVRAEIRSLIEQSPDEKRLMNANIFFPDPDHPSNVALDRAPDKDGRRGASETGRTGEKTRTRGPFGFMS